jgi:hypothetical protein
LGSCQHALSNFFYTDIWILLSVRFVTKKPIRLIKLCVHEVSNKLHIRVGKQDDMILLVSYAIGKVQENYIWLELSSLSRCLFVLINLLCWWEFINNRNCEGI